MLYFAGSVAWGLSPSLIGLAQKTRSRTRVPRVSFQRSSFVIAYLVFITFGGSGGGLFCHGRYCKSLGRESTAGTSGSSPITSPENPLRIKPESFSATSGESWVAWIRKFKSIAALNKWSPELQAKYCLHT